MTDDKSVVKERERLQSLLDRAAVPQGQQAALDGIIENLSWMRVKLSEARDQLQDEGIVSTYEHGGGQSGTHENPMFKAYNNLWRSYVIGWEKFTAYLPKEMADEVTGGTTLEKVLARKERRKK